MDVRDVYFWTDEAHRRVLVRRLDAYHAALFPQQKQRTMETELTRLRTQIKEIDEAGDIAAVEQENRLMMAEKNKRLRERQRRKRAEREAGVAPKKRQHKTPPGVRELKAQVKK